MTLKQLEYFLAIAENGSITKAANTLRISQPPLSLQLKGLEEELGCQLFVRDKKNMVITAKGILLRDKAKEIIDKVNETTLLLRSADDESRTTIHLGTISSICDRILPEKVLLLKNRFPNLDFVLHEGSSISILDMLDKNAVHFGIVREPFNVSAYNTRPIKDPMLGDSGDDYFVALAKPEYFGDDNGDVVPLSSLKDKPVILHKRYCNLFSTACRQQGFVPNIICQNDSFHSSLSWAGSGIGIAVEPYTSASLNSNPCLVMRRIDNPTIVSKAHLVWNKNTVLTSEQKAFVQLFT